MNSISKIVDEAVAAFSTLPGIGKKSALRMVLHLAQQDKKKLEDLYGAVKNMSEKLIRCKQCFAYSDSELCTICSDPVRNQQTICVIESIRDLFAIEELQQFRGVYHVLGGLISPIDGMGPENLTIHSLFQRIENQPISELIFAIRPTIEGDTTSYYITRHLNNPSLKITMLARGVSFGSELEFADELTLSRSLLNRTPYIISE